jgi:hydrogenase maturation factor
LDNTFSLACKGGVIAPVSPHDAGDALHALQATLQAQQTATVGRIEDWETGVSLQTK